jgi:pimeloyl-ACP methyl ester carboxylesterase
MVAKVVAMKRTAVVLVHGLFSSAKTWNCFTNLISSDPELARFSLAPFEYATPRFKLNPLQSIPDFDTLAESLQTFIAVDLAAYESIVLVSHSQGGLIIQRYLAWMISRGRARELVRIRRIVMFACPNSGADLFILARRGLKVWHHPQESELRPLNKSVADAHQMVLDHIVYARRTSDNKVHIPIVAYVGETDNVVKPVSAKGDFPETGVIPGNHFSIIQPDSPQHRSYIVLKASLLAVNDIERKRGRRPGRTGEVHEARFSAGSTRQYGSIPSLVRELEDASFDAVNWTALASGTQALREALTFDYHAGTRVQGLLSDLRETLGDAVSPLASSNQLSKASRHAMIVRDTLITLLTS